jgi:hypothetical protein
MVAALASMQQEAADRETLLDAKPESPREPKAIPLSILVEEDKDATSQSGASSNLGEPSEKHAKHRHKHESAKDLPHAVQPTERVLGPESNALKKSTRGRSKSTSVADAKEATEAKDAKEEDGERRKDKKDKKDKERLRDSVSGAKPDESTEPVAKGLEASQKKVHRSRSKSRGEMEAPSQKEEGKDALNPRSSHIKKHGRTKSKSSKSAQDDAETPIDEEVDAIGPHVDKEPPHVDSKEPPHKEASEVSHAKATTSASRIAPIAIEHASTSTGNLKPRPDTLASVSPRQGSGRRMAFDPESSMAQTLAKEQQPQSPGRFTETIKDKTIDSSMRVVGWCILISVFFLDVIIHFVVVLSSYLQWALSRPCSAKLC